jgi:hypothetical protein
MFFTLLVEERQSARARVLPGTENARVWRGFGFKVAGHPEMNYKKAMTAVTALEQQIQIYRHMTGEQRLAIALNLHEMSCEIAREGIRRQHPEASAPAVERLLRRRIQLSRSA